MEGSKTDQIEERLIEFSISVIKLAQCLPRTPPCRHISVQILRSSTGSASNYAEARGAESRADFIHKLGIALKELREARCWLAMTIRCELLPSARLNELTKESDELVRILAKSVATARKGPASNRR